MGTAFCRPRDAPERASGTVDTAFLRDMAAKMLLARTETGSMGIHQVLAGHAVGMLVGLSCGMRYSDMGALRAIRSEALAALGLREMGFGWNVEMQMRAARAGLRILEVPVPYGLRAGGHSKVAGTVGGAVRAATRILATVARISLGRWPGPSGRPLDRTDRGRGASSAAGSLPSLLASIA